MPLDEPRWEPREAILAPRGRPLEPFRFAGLWVVGDLAGLARPTLAIVGSRAPSEAGARRAREFGRAFARAGLTVLSGLALGIDGAAHAGALAGGGVTLGILGGGHRHFFPRRNRGLAEAMLAAGGAVLSPYPPDEPARPYQFLERNGVVAALADGVVIVEAAARSGALNTASWASARGIQVFAVPGDVDRPKAAGCNALIRDGVTLVREPADVLADLSRAALPLPGLVEPQRVGAPTGELPAGGVPAGEAPAGDPLEASLLAALAREPLEFERLFEAVAVEPGPLLAALLRLELAGHVERRDERYAVTAGARRRAAKPSRA
jgi:DNA processing protein